VIDRRDWIGSFSVIEGFETFRCLIDQGDIAMLAKLGSRVRVNENLAGGILYRRKELGRRLCLPADIDSVSILPLSDRYHTLEVRIKVGQFTLADFLKAHVMHGGFVTQLSGFYLIASCNCGAVEVLDARSIV
jgi:hypothetical protein